MKICVNGVVRDMTPAEMAAMQQGRENTEGGRKPCIFHT